MKERAYPVYTVNKHAEGLLVGGHPWVYENDILNSPENEPENGTLADVVSTKGSYLGTGFVSLKSKIRVRLISRNANDTFDAAFWRRRVEYAWSYRKTVLEPADLSACRVIFGEADQFPGLTVDRFSNILVTQTLSVGMEKLKPVLFPILAEVLRADGQTIDGIYERNDEALRAKEGLEQNKGWFELPGETHPASTQTEICGVLGRGRILSGSSGLNGLSIVLAEQQTLVLVQFLLTAVQINSNSGKGTGNSSQNSDHSDQARFLHRFVHSFLIETVFQLLSSACWLLLYPFLSKITTIQVKKAEISYHKLLI